MNTRATRNPAGTRASAEAPPEKPDRHDLLPRFAVWALLTSLGAWLYFRLFAFPRTPFLLTGDQVYFSFYGQRLLLGERIYRDFFQFTPPGADLIYAAAFWMFGPHAWVPNVIVLGLGMLLGCIVLYIARRVMDSRAAMLTTTLALILYGYMANGTHHWFSVLCVLAGVAILTPSLQNTRLGMAGALFATASFFTQTTGAAALAGSLLFLALRMRSAEESRKGFLLRTFWLLAGFASLSLLLNAYFLVQAGPGLMWDCQVTYVTRYFLPTATKISWSLGSTVSSWRESASVAVYFLSYALIPATYAIALLRHLKPKQNREPLPAPLLLLSLVGLFLFLEVAKAPNWVRWFPASMPALIVCMALCEHRLIRRFVFMAAWIAVLIVAFKLLWTPQRSHPVIAELRTGHVAIPSEAKYDELLWLAHRTTPEEWFYQAGGPPTLYSPLALRNPAYVSEIYPDSATRPEFVSQIIEALEEKQVHFVVWTYYLDLPAMGSEDNLGPLRSYLHSHYKLVKTFANREEAWERNATTVPTISAPVRTAASGGSSHE